MTVGALTMACLLLVPCQVGNDVHVFNRRDHKIPITIDAKRKTDLKELVLFVSTDEGKNWQQHAAVTPDRDHFVYFAPADGIYWFRVTAVNNQGKQDPENVFRMQPQETLKLQIDTTPPQFRIVGAQRQGDELVVAWEAQDEFIDPRSLSIQYRVNDASPPVWLSMPVTFAPSGQARVRLTAGGPVSIKAEIRDLAKNISHAQVEVTGIATAAAAGNTNPPVSTPPTPAVQQTPPPAVPPPAVKPTEATPAPGPPPVASPPTTSNSSPTNTLPPAQPTAVVARSDDPPPVPAQQAPLPGAQASRMPRLQVVNDPEITLHYKLDKVGPSGVGRVEIWITEDGGKNWMLYGDEDKLPPASADGTYKEILTLPREEAKIFGLCLVVKSKVGLGKSPPRPGDVPEMMVEVDLTKPNAQLFSPMPDAERRDAVVLTWKAYDRNLTNTPITLEWAERDVGPWEKIGTDLPNTGRYSWPLPPQIPDRVYLRIRVRDKAGNEGIAVTSQPQALDLSEPVGQLLNITPAPKDHR